MVVEGIENLEPDEIYIYVANHTSLFDIPVLAYAIPDTICFMYKKELLDIPMLGFGLRHSPYIPIERENPKHAVSSISKAIKAVNSTGSVVLFPEGTRSTDGKVGAFKRGAFAIAGKSNKKIVPISIIGMNKILSAGNLNLKSGRVKVIINPPVDRVPDDKKSLQEFIDNLHGIIAQQVSDEKNIL